VANQKYDYARHDRAGRQYHKAERCFASRILDRANGVRGDKGAEIADRIYQSNATGSGEPVRKPVREGPEAGRAATSRCCFFGLLGCSDGIYFSVGRMLAEWP
jgi:hypothetical protein